MLARSVRLLVLRKKLNAFVVCLFLNFVLVAGPESQSLLTSYLPKVCVGNQSKRVISCTILSN